jgi:anti-sigma regulatory factor (Ser/Thr protein kinase)
MSEHLSLNLKNDLQEIERMANEVDAWWSQHARLEEFKFQLDLVLDEMVSNVIRHGLKDSNEHRILVNLSCDGDDLTVEIQDDGVAFNPLEAPVPDTTKPLEERPIGGLGIHLVRQIMDDLSYRRHDGKNYLVMRKKLVEGL